MTTNTPEPEVRACGCRTEAVIDLAALAAAGWKRYSRHPLDLGTSWVHGHRHIWNADDGAILIWNSDAGAITITDLIWQEALTIIQQHSGRGPATGGNL